MIRTTGFCGSSLKNIDEQDICKCAPAIDEKVAVKADVFLFNWWIQEL